MTPKVPAPAPAPAPAANQVMERIVGALKSVDWQQLGKDLQVFGKRFAGSDFARIQPGPQEQPAVAAFLPRMAALIVWRRALLVLACLFTVTQIIKSCFDPLTVGAQVHESVLETNMKEARKQNSNLTAEQIKAVKEASKTNADATIKTLGESNVGILNTLSLGLWLSGIASLVFLVMAAAAWRDWRRSRKLALIAIGALLIPQLLAMLIPWSSMMSFDHVAPLLRQQGYSAEQAEMGVTAIRGLVPLLIVFAVLMSGLPFFYGLFNGVLRASLSTKTLVPASIVSGWGTMLLALTISVPWFIVLSVIDQTEQGPLAVIGAICLLAAPLTIILKCRRLGLPLSPEEASALVKKSKLIFTGLNFAGIALGIAWLNEADWSKNIITTSAIITMIIHYFANLLLIQVVAVDMLVLLLERAHRKLAADPAPDEPLRQLGEVLPKV